ncbi:copper resistance protein B [Sandaracinobacter sp. RS1-74]|uniref:copper resistance protein B n=1 Tax=Sandaracinobacteroides sayramensis TaxID=2913411 RepID=UPI001EDA3EA3|nr:copper resistance protein B [Sandaracinobacteroides sayramensis]MCG2842117.1 copper resistance protein B [Sandaracinobacteroides sayramensis]
MRAALLTAALLAAAPAAGQSCTPDEEAMGFCTAQAPAGDAPPPAPVPADQADRIWGKAAMEPVRAAVYAEHGGGQFSRILIDLAEVRFADGAESWLVEADGWFGGDMNRLVVKADAEGEFGGGLHDLKLTALYSRAIDPYFNLQAGVRHDVRPQPQRTHIVAGISGLAPYWFEVDGYLQLSTKGELRATASAEYDLRLTQRLILQPKLELELSAQDIPELAIGSGLVRGEAGLRLRYEIAREFAPYLGVVHESRFGRTADFARAAGESASGTAFVLGVRAWF